MRNHRNANNIELLSNKIYVSCRELFYVLIGEPLKYDPDFKGPIHGKQRYVGIEWPAPTS